MSARPRTDRSTVGDTKLTVRLPAHLVERIPRPVNASLRRLAEGHYLDAPLPELAALVEARGLARSEVAFRSGVSREAVGQLLDFGRASAETERLLYRWMLGVTR